MATAVLGDVRIDDDGDVAVIDDRDELYEVVDGQRVEKPPMGSREQHVASRLGILMGHFALIQGLGHVEVEMLFNFGREELPKRRPDVAFVSYERWARGRAVPSTSAWSVIPDLAVEVVSPSNSADHVLDKVGEYFRAGVRLVWVVYPSQRLVYVYDAPTTTRILGVGQDLDGGAALPGFRLPVLLLFEDGPAPA